MADSGKLTIEESKVVTEKVVGEFRKVMDNIGITEDLLGKKLLEELDAQETKVFQYQGKVIEKSGLTAWEVRQRARQDAHKLRGDYPSEKHHITVEGLPIVPLTEDEQLSLEARKQIIKERAMKKCSDK